MLKLRVFLTGRAAACAMQAIATSTSSARGDMVSQRDREAVACAHGGERLHTAPVAFLPRI